LYFSYTILYLSAMERYHQYHPLAIADFEAAQWEHPKHNHNHYELIYIKRGFGKHFIQDVANGYKPGDVFLLGPEDDHYFEIAEATRFIYLKFTDPYIYNTIVSAPSYLQKLEYLIKSRDTHLSGFTLKPEDLNAIDKIFDVIVSLKENVFSNEEVLWLQVLAITSLLQRNMPELKNTRERNSDMQAVFCYIHKFIYEPERLKANSMASHFNISADYFGPYFKRNAGVTLRGYIKAYRKNIILQRISGGRYSLKQIAVEFGLTDESHVSKILKSL